MPAYIGREEAAQVYKAEHLDHIYQGDLFQSLELMLPRSSGDWDPRIWDGIVVSHSCEYTKIRGRLNKPLLVAPVRKLSVYSQRDAILRGEAYGLWALPQESPLDDDEYVVDLRFIQPIAIGKLDDESYWTSVTPSLQDELQARLALFLLRKERIGE